MTDKNISENSASASTTDSGGDTPSKPDVRKLVIKALNRIIDGGAYTDVVCDKIQRDAGLSDKDNRLFTELVSGIVKSKLTIDHILSGFIEKGFEKLPPVLVNILRLGAYQLLYLDRVPAFAAVNSSTELAKINFNQNMAGLVNGVLRNIQKRDRDELLGLQTASGADTQPMPLGARYSIPPALLNFLESELATRPEGYLEQLLEFFHLPSITYLRVNRIKTTAGELAEKLTAEKTTAVPDAIFPENVLDLESGRDIRKTKCWKDGLLNPQSLGSILSPILLDPKVGGSVLDMCAAPGGKTSHLSSIVGDNGLVMAIDVNQKRFDELQKNCYRLGALNIAAVLADATEISAIVRDNVDKVLLDAPCSGLGTLGRKADLRYQFDPKNLKELVKLQKKLIKEALKVLKPGGELLYSVCTFTLEETTQLINDILADDFRVTLPGGRTSLEAEDCWVSASDLLKARNDENISSEDALKGILDERGAIYLDPVSFKTDGFFYAKLIKSPH